MSVKESEMDAQEMNGGAPPGAELHGPVKEFHGSHEFIIEGLHSLEKLPELAAALERARLVAHSTLTLFDKVVHEHHADEEQELFVHVQKSCKDIKEGHRVHELVARLAADHRRIEKMWLKLRPAVAATAQGKVHDVPDFRGDVAKLVEIYLEHAQLEEEVFLPLADAILTRDANHMAALDVALHLRHAPPPRGAYV
jgi:hemerythrin-like domain-containing protein